MGNKSDKIYSDMTAGKPLEQLDDGSKSAWYEAFNRWKPSAEETYTTYTKEINAIKARKALLADEINRSENELNVCRDALTTEKKALETAQTAKDATIAEYNDAEAKISAVNKRLTDLKAKGITEETLNAIGSTDVSNSVELMTRVKTSKEAEALSEQNAALETSLGQKRGVLARETSRLEAVKQETQSEVNRRDEFRSTNSTYIALLDVLFAFYRRGYSEPILKMLLAGLKKLEVAGDPKLSVMRAIEALEKGILLEQLDSAIRAKQATLQTLQSTIDEIKGMIEGYRDVALASLNQVSSATVRKIGSLMDQYTTTMNNLNHQHITNLERLYAANEMREDNVVLAFTKEIQFAKNETVKIHSMVVQALHQYKQEVVEWGKIREEVGQYEQLLQNTTVLLAAKKDINLIQKLPPEYIISLLQGVDLYVQARLQDSETLPSKRLLEKEKWAFNSLYSAKIRNVSAWLLEDLTRRHVEGYL